MPVRLETIAWSTFQKNHLSFAYFLIIHCFLISCYSIVTCVFRQDQNKREKQLSEIKNGIDCYKEKLKALDEKLLSD